MLVSSSFTSNDCSQYPQHLSHNTYNDINTTYHKLSNCSSSSNSSEHLKNDDGKSLPTTNVATFIGIQKLMELDRHKIQNIIQSKHSYQYDSPFHSSDSNRYAPSVLSANNIPPQSLAIPHVSTHIQSHSITEISIPSVPTQHSPDRLYHLFQSDYLPKQRLFKPIKYQQGIWTKDRLRKFYPLYLLTSSPF